jgi:hypothetical protein
MSALSFTKLFKSILDSTLWVQHPLHVKVTWIAMLAMADADGMVAASIPGLAQRAGVTVAECEQALAVFLAPDKYSRTPAHEGRRIREIKGGWELLNYVTKRKEMTAEWTREQKREYMRRWRSEQSGHVPPNSLREPESGNVDSLSLSSSRSDLSDPDPERAHDEQPPCPPTFRRLPKTWKPGDALYGEAVIAGVTKEALDDDVTYWRSRDLGADVFDFADFFRSHFSRLKKRSETERYRESQERAPGAKRFGPALTLEPTEKHRRFAAKFGIDLAAVIKQLVDEGAIDSVGLGRAKEMIGERMSLLARKQKQALVGAERVGA